MNSYDIEEAFRRIEEELIASAVRNLVRHQAEEEDMGFRWTQWQVEQLRLLEEYKRDNAAKFKKQFAEINGSIDGLITAARESGNAEAEEQILRAIRRGAKLQRRPEPLTGGFFNLNTRKLEALIEATVNDFDKAEHAMLRRANDQYRSIIYSAQVYANTGAGTYQQAVDMAAKDFLSAGINCIEYSNGARHTMHDYASMVIRTATKRAKFVGEGEKRKEWGITTVIVNKRGNPCPKCLPFIGKIFVDDIWSGGKSTDGNYPLLSSAVEAGLYHPNCKDSHHTYFPGITSVDDQKLTEEDIEDISETASLDEKAGIAQGNYERYDRLERNALDQENKEKYKAKKEQWEREYKKCYRIRKNASRDKEQFERYRNVLGDMAPETLEKFIDLKYNDDVWWKKQKTKYRIVNQYKVDFGEMNPREILVFDMEVIKEKREKFSSKYKKSGNIAAVRIDQKPNLILAHSMVSKVPLHQYKGDNQLVGLKDNRHYVYKDVKRPNGSIRRDTFHDTEAKLFEYLRDLYDVEPFHRIDMLSERGMCDSCKSVAKQFEKEHPGVTMNVVSNKKEIGNVWKHRYEKNK